MTVLSKHVTPSVLKTLVVLAFEFCPKAFLAIENQSIIIVTKEAVIKGNLSKFVSINYFLPMYQNHKIPKFWDGERIYLLKMWTGYGVTFNQ